MGDAKAYWRHQLVGFNEFWLLFKKNDFSEIEWYVHNPKVKKANFFTGITGALIFDKRVYDSDLFTMFEMAGEIIPIKSENGEELFLLNVLECVNCLNEKGSERDIYDDGSKGRLLKYAFYENCVSESSIFKIPETSQTEILTYVDVKGEADEFFYEYQKAGLSGLIFEQIFPNIGRDVN